MTAFLTRVTLCVHAVVLIGVHGLSVRGRSEDVIRNSFKCSFQDCVDKCDASQSCVEVTYYRRYQLCQLLKEHDLNQKLGSYTYTKSPMKVSEQARICENCIQPNECAVHRVNDVTETTCTIQHCERPPAIRGATLLGNVFSIGSKVKLRCTAQDYDVECLADGTWSRHNLTCPCLAPNVPYTMVSVSRGDPGLLTANVECVEGYTLLDQVSPICEPSTDVWTPSFDEVCCDAMYVGEWQKIFRYQGNTTERVLNLWNSNDPDTERVKADCTYGNKTILNDWNGAVKFSTVKFYVIKNEQIVAYIVFNAAGSDSSNWFDQKRILESSWEDLTPYTDLEVFSLNANTDQQANPRFLIGKKVHEDSCDLDLGWFAVSWSRYPCNAPETGHMAKIVYSPYSTVTKMADGYVDIADRFEVWIA